eukprot:GDKJ01040627.1.p1 GENE.GDKJ01040627.1~~GDKJ01040627.1.p1  ORF type:complete len:597 (+),score=116.72 GDKJ01040627.1:86-1876(+)
MRSTLTDPASVRLKVPTHSQTSEPLCAPRSVNSHVHKRSILQSDSLSGFLHERGRSTVMTSSMGSSFSNSKDSKLVGTEEKGCRDRRSTDVKNDLVKSRSKNDCDGPKTSTFSSTSSLLSRDSTASNTSVHQNPTSSKQTNFPLKNRTQIFPLRSVLDNIRDDGVRILKNENVSSCIDKKTEGQRMIPSKSKIIRKLPVFVPKRISGGWILTSVLGKGGFAFVMAATQVACCPMDSNENPSTEEQSFEEWDITHAAIKVFDRRFLVLEKSRMNNVLREIRFLKQIQDTVGGTLQLRGVSETESALCIVTQHLGTSLHQLFLKTPNSFPDDLKERLIRHILLNLCLTLFFLHETFQIAHRDVKLDNLLLVHKNTLEMLKKTELKYSSSPFSSPDSTLPKDLSVVKLIDFGLAVHDAPAPFANKTMSQSVHRRAFCGTTQYMSPELARRSGCYDAFKVDVWAVGVVAYALTFNTVPFRSPSTANLHDAIRKGILNGREWRQSSNEFLGGVKEFISGLLVIDAEARPTMRDVLKMPWLLKGISFDIDEVSTLNLDFYDVSRRMKLFEGTSDTASAVELLEALYSLDVASPIVLEDGDST